MRVHYLKMLNMAHIIYLLKFSLLPKNLFYILFVITSAGFVPCGSPKKALRTSSTVHVIFSIRPLGSIRCTRDIYV